jgi:hypothetical protein
MNPDRGNKMRAARQIGSAHEAQRENEVSGFPASRRNNPALLKYKSSIPPQASGAIAQLGERVVRNDEAVGSIPTSSTKSSKFSSFGTFRPINPIPLEILAAFPATMWPLPPICLLGKILAAIALNPGSFIYFGFSRPKPLTAVVVGV